MPRRPAPLAALAVLALALLAGGAPRARAGAAPPALEPPSTGGLPAVERSLARLAVHKRLLVVGAHPDDEDTALLTLVARGMGGEAAYLSLSRGEGGQNLIGPELGVDLGLLRTRELLAARAIDGGRQFFTRAYDFGYTRSLAETFSRWPREVLLEDAVRVVRRFKPQVVVSVFSGVPHPNHGQHQAAGVTAYEAYRAAGDPAALPQLAAEGLAPWRPQALYRSTGFDRDATTLTLPLGVIDPLTGRSIFQLALASRSEHRSQDMGRLLDLGPRDARVGWVDGGPGAPGGAPGAAAAGGDGIFAGIDTHLAALAAPLSDPGLRRRVAEHLQAAEELAVRARATLVPERLAAAVPGLAEVLGHLRAARDALAAEDEVAARQAAELVAEKIGVAESGLAAAAGVAVEAAVARETVTAGETLPVQLSVWNSGREPLASAAATVVAAPEWGLEPVVGTVAAVPGTAAGGTATATSAAVRGTAAGAAAAGGAARTSGAAAGGAVAGAGAAARPVGAGELVTWTAAVPIPAGAPPTSPYFLRRPLLGALYDWSAAPPAERGEPFEPPPLTARFALTIAGVPVTLEREVVYRVGDQARGEIRRPLRVVPAIEVALERDLLVWPLDRKTPRRLEVTLVSRALAPLAGRLEGRWAPAGGVAGAAPWPALPPQPFTLAPGERSDLELVITPPARLTPGRTALEVAAVLEDGRRFAAAFPLIEHEHVPPTPRPAPARLEVTATALALPPLRHVGYVRGASDRVPELLREVGVPLELLGERELLHGDLGRYEAIVIGSRAYETEPALGRANGRLLDYVRRGGLVIVQYQQYPFVEGGYAPYPLEIARPHDRVTDETAPMTPLIPDHPVFTTPNKLGPADWEGWVQERGLYFAHTWDPTYTPLLATADPGGPELRGGLLVAKLGEGTYVYTGLALFRQIPAGVPGAYRLMANLLGLARPPRGGAGH